MGAVGGMLPSHDGTCWHESRKNVLDEGNETCLLGVKQSI